MTRKGRELAAVKRSPFADHRPATGYQGSLRSLDEVVGR
jgi:hypothetical protein